MKTQFTFLLSLVLFTSSTLSKVPLNTESNQLYWTGKAAFSTYSLTGTIAVSEIASKINADTLQDLHIVIDMSSLNHDNQDLKTHLKSEDFFDVNNYTTATFTLSKPSRIKNGKVKITGDLQIKNITKPQEFEVMIVADKMILDITINRTDYGITFNSPTFFEKMKDQAIADEFRLKGEIEF